MLVIKMKKKTKQNKKNNSICIVLWVKWFLKECWIKVYIFNYIYNFDTFGFIVSLVLFQINVLLCQNIWCLKYINKNLLYYLYTYIVLFIEQLSGQQGLTSFCRRLHFCGKSYFWNKKKNRIENVLLRKKTNSTELLENDSKFSFINFIETSKVNRYTRSYFFMLLYLTFKNKSP